MSTSIVFASLTAGTGVAWVASKFLVKNDTPKPFWAKYGADYFLIVLAVFLFRAFFFEPYSIPSPSMVPTLRVSDYILTKKYAYSAKMPVTGKVIKQFSSPEVGDVIVFTHPLMPKMDYVKRVIGLPGDRISYLDKQLYINDVKVEKKPSGLLHNKEKNFDSQLFEEVLGGRSHSIINDEPAPAYVHNPEDYQNKNKCQYEKKGVTCVVPEGHYFVLGDNRDNSHDSRFWGFVPFENIEGKAIYVLFNTHGDSQFVEIK